MIDLFVRQKKEDPKNFSLMKDEKEKEKEKGNLDILSDY